jgi:hypothetical protein
VSPAPPSLVAAVSAVEPSPVLTVASVLASLVDFASSPQPARVTPPKNKPKLAIRKSSAARISLLLS